eukprot:snap_masked-scaffold_5-processed-gene-20.43-mRNA-1 protein AED:1.00 eAED:1.00 QI:0/-1/0/0/-1/1/1/0/69
MFLPENSSLQDSYCIKYTPVIYLILTVIPLNKEFSAYKAYGYIVGYPEKRIKAEMDKFCPSIVPTCDLS